MAWPKNLFVAGHGQTTPNNILNLHSLMLYTRSVYSPELRLQMILLLSYYLSKSGFLIAALAKFGLPGLSLATPGNTKDPSSGPEEARVKSPLSFFVWPFGPRISPWCLFVTQPKGSPEASAEILRHPKRNARNSVQKNRSRIPFWNIFCPFGGGSKNG